MDKKAGVVLILASIVVAVFFLIIAIYRPLTAEIGSGIGVRLDR